MQKEPKKTTGQAAEIIEVRPCYPADLCRMYGVTPRTFRKWISPHLQFIGKRIGNYYTTLQVLIIIERLGPPECNKEK